MEEAWELAAVSRAKDLRDFLVYFQALGEKNPGSLSSNIAVLFAKELNIANTLSGFVSVYCRMVDAAVDEVLGYEKFDPARRDRMVIKIQKSRGLITTLGGQSWRESAGRFITNDFLDILELVDDAMSASGKTDVFDKKQASEYFNDLNEIYSGILESNLPLSIKAPVLGHLKRLIDIFKTLNATGSLDAELRIKAILGDIIMNGEDISKASQDSKDALQPLLEFIQKYYPKFKWTVDLVTTGANVTLLGIQSGAI